MTLYEIIQTLKGIALTQPNIKSATDGSIYDIMNTNPSVKYDVFHISQTTHQSDEDYDYYGFNLFFVSRLEDSLEDNRLQIQSIGIEVLENILRTLCENWSIDFPTITYTPFTQKFQDLCAGVYCTVRLAIPEELICADDYIAEVVPGKDIKLQDMGITITQNGLTVVTPDAEYDGIGEIRIVTQVPQTTAVLEYKEVEYTENGEYVVRPSVGYDGLSDVAVSVNVPDRYEDGYEDGEADQKSKLIATAFTENGEYTRADGYSAITVNVPAGEGDYLEGYIDGMNAQKAKMVTTAFTENGGYSREDGYSTVYVNVPQTGYTQDDLDKAYEDGYKDGLDACSGQPAIATSVTLNVSSSITDSGSATTTVNPSSAVTVLRYSSSDTTKATIDEITGKITVIASGSVQFCVTDLITNLQDCKTVNVAVTPPSYQTLHFVYETTGANETVIFFDTAHLPDSSTYEITISDETRSWVNDLLSMEIDGVETAVTSAYTFDTAGKHIVKYNSPNPYVPDYLFSLAKNPHPYSTAQNEKLVEAHIGEGFALLLTYAFDGDKNLSAVTLPSTMKVLGNTPFADTKIRTITIPDSVTASTAITDYRPYLNRYVRNSEDKCWFSGCTSLSSVTLGSGITMLPAYAFSGCTSLHNVEIPNSVTRICDGAFMEASNLSGITIPNSLSGIGKEAFYTTKLMNTITLPDTIREIGSWSFTNASRVRTVIFGTGITTISSDAFYFTSITTMQFNGTVPPTLGSEDALGPRNRTGFYIYVPAAAVDTYKAAWPYYANKITAITN